jgi:signal transduction histidine kinase
MSTAAIQKRVSLPGRFALGVLLTLALTLVGFYFLMNPPMNDIWLMAGFLTITAVISGLSAFAAYRLGWIQRSPKVRWTLIGGYALASALTFLNVWMTAWLMFVNTHDLLLATVLLFFAGGIAMVLGYFFSSALTDRIQLLDQAARAIAVGDLEVRVPVEGRDEIALLADTFNSMAAGLQAAEQKKADLENLRRDLIAWAGHDLQTPLASIRAIVEALADGVVEEPELQQRYLRTARKDILSLTALIDDLFQMSQLDAGGLALDLEYNSLSDLISDTLEEFSHLAENRDVSRGEASLLE